MPSNASYARLFFWKDFHMQRKFDMQSICTSMLAKFYSCKNWVLQLRSERDHDYYGPYYDQPYWQCSPEGGHILGGIKVYSRNLKWVCWPVNFKTSGVEKYDGSTNPTVWLEVYQLAIEATKGDS
jgi:hypothetical protein